MAIFSGLLLLLAGVRPCGEDPAGGPGRDPGRLAVPGGDPGQAGGRQAWRCEFGLRGQRAEVTLWWGGAWHLGPGGGCLSRIIHIMMHHTPEAERYPSHACVSVCMRMRVCVCACVFLWLGVEEGWWWTKGLKRTHRSDLDWGLAPCPAVPYLRNGCPSSVVSVCRRCPLFTFSPVVWGLCGSPGH